MNRYLPITSLTIALLFFNLMSFGNTNFSKEWEDPTKSSAMDVVAGDIDDDGDLDIFIANSSNEDVSSIILFNDGEGDFSQKNQVIPYKSTAGDLGDIDNDGDLDLCFVDNNNVIRIWYNQDDGQYVESDILIESKSGFEDLCLGYLNADTLLDILVMNLEHPDQLFFNNGDSTFTESTQSFGPTGWAGAGSIDIGDLNGDGHTDIIKGNWESPKTEVWLNNGSGTFTKTDQEFSSTQYHIHAVKLGDIDNDNDLDAVLGYSASSLGVEVWLNDGEGIFTRNQILRLDATNYIQDIVLADFNGDDFPDAFFATLEGSNALAINNGEGTMEESDIIFPGNTSWTCTAGDFDGDDDIDIFNTSKGEFNSVWINKPETATASLKEWFKDNDVILYPNPTKDKIYLNTAENNTFSNYKIINISGDIIKQGRLTNQSVDISEFAEGIYSLQLYSEGVFSVHPFIKN